MLSLTVFALCIHSRFFFRTFAVCVFLGIPCIVRCGLSRNQTEDLWQKFWQYQLGSFGPKIKFVNPRKQLSSILRKKTPSVFPDSANSAALHAENAISSGHKRFLWESSHIRFCEEEGHDFCAPEIACLYKSKIHVDKMHMTFCVGWQHLMNGGKNLKIWCANNRIRTDVPTMDLLVLPPIVSLNTVILIH